MTVFVCTLFSNLAFSASERDLICAVEDSSTTKRDHTPDTSYHHKIKLAALFSALAPGTGQIYNEYGYNRYCKKRNRAWWKTPIIWGALGVTGYYLKSYLDSTHIVKKEYNWQLTHPGSYWSPEYQNYELSDLVFDYNRYADRRDLFVLLTLGVYGLNVIEALVDAHFVTFDVSDKLSFEWSPVLYDRNSAGLSLSLKF